MAIHDNPEELFKGSRFSVLNVDVLHGQRKLKREIVSHPGAAVILPLLNSETLLLIRNERYAVGESLLELPAGTLEEGEDPLSCASRELVEETGYKAQKMTPLLHFYSSPGFCTEILYVFLAEELTQVGQSLDDGERIVVVPTPLTKALEWIREKVIHDAKTVTSILYYSRFNI